MGQNDAVNTIRFEELTPEELLGPLNDVEKKNAPPKLYVAGDRGVMTRGARVCIVGSRKPSAAGLAEASELARGLARLGVVVVSGLAEGIDTAAHEAAIQESGQTVAVLGTPLDQVFPARNRPLQECIMREHLAVSEFPSGSGGGPGGFPRRNRTMALLSDATVIVEAGETSGTRHQGWEALRLGRPLFFLERFASTSGASWVSEMMGYGAQVLSPGSLELLFEFIPERAGDEASRIAL